MEENALNTKKCHYHGDFEDDANFEYDTDFKIIVIIKTMTITEQVGDEKTAGGWSEHTWSCFIARSARIR